MKKVLYIVEFSPDEPNSVGNILHVLLDQACKCNLDQVLCYRKGFSFCNFTTQILNEGYKIYSGNSETYIEIIKNHQYSLLKKLALLSKKGFYGLARLFLKEKISSLTNIRYLERVIDLENPDLLIWFTFSPSVEYIELGKRKRIKSLQILYDTYIFRPGLGFEQCRKEERIVIDNCISYFVPSFFYENYDRIYHDKRIVSYNLPLLIDVDKVVAAFNTDSIKYNYSYYGQIQKFRNEKQIKELCRQLNVQIDVFSNQDITEDDTFVFHHAVSGEELYKTVSHSKFLVAFDNNAPYDFYLPSKVYLYASFTKPVIAFGENDRSALIEFFSNYPKFYYHRLGQSTEGLKHFIENNQSSSGFCQNIYNQYLEYLPNNALEPILKAIRNALK